MSDTISLAHLFAPDPRVRVTASGPGADTPEGRRALAEMKTSFLIVDDARGPYRTTPQGNRATRRRAAAQARRP